MGRYELLAAWMGAAHRHHQTPHCTISIAATRILVVCLH
jgi:hypothetical protein